GNIDILANSDRDGQSVTEALAGGLLGISGAVSVVSIGTAIDSDGSTEFTSGLQTQVNGDIRVRDSNTIGGVNIPVLRTSDDATAATALTDLQNLADPTVSGALSTTASTSDRITGALVQTATSATNAAEIAS